MNTSQSAESPRRASPFKKLFSYLFLIALFLGALGFWWKYYFVFGEGVKSGQLNQLVKKGNFFKTYEGKLIQSGLRSRTPGTVNSYEFEFSVLSDSLAEILEANSGRYLDLHYQEFKGTLPWRGYSRYVVDRIVKIHDDERRALPD